jgi:hypothetical protein
MEATRWLASVVGWIPAVLVAALLMVGGIAATTHWVSDFWFRVLLAVVQATAWPLILTFAYMQERAELTTHEQSGQNAGDREAEFQTAEAYDARWQIEDRLRERHDELLESESHEAQ